MKYLTYIQSTGTQYIDTNYIPKSNSKIEVDLAYTTTSAQYSGIFEGGSWFMFGVNSKHEAYIGGAVQIGNTANTSRFQLSVDISSKTSVLAGTSYTLSTTYTPSTVTMPIFAYKDTNAIIGYAKFKLYGYKIYEGTTLVRNFYPIEDDNGNLGLYDKVNKVFYANAGTGTFTKGEYTGETTDEPAGGGATTTLSHTFTRLLNNVLYYGKVFVVNPKGRVNLRCDLASVFAMPQGSVLLSNMPIGTEIKIPVNGVDCNFIVINQGNPDSTLYDSSCDGTWLLMKDCYDKRIWGPENETITDMGHYAYGEGTGNIHDWCNQTFFNYLDSDVKSIIKQVKIPYVSGNGVSHNETKSGSSGLLCKVFILAAREVCSPFNETDTPYDGARLEYFKDASSGNPSATEAYLNGVSVDWWTRSPVITEYGNILLVAGCAYGSGLRGINNPLGGNLPSIASRPAFILPSDTECELTPNADGSYNLNLAPPFPEKPNSYSLINTYTSSTTFTAPEDGWYQVELFGRSGEGGWSHINCGDGDDNWKITGYTGLSRWITGAVAGGGAGGGGAYCCSTDIKLNKGDKIGVTLSNLSGTNSKSYVKITSSAGETYSDMVCMSGGDGSDGYAPNNSAVGLTGGSGGTGGVASGGNYMNKNGGAGATGAIDSAFRLDKEDILAPANGGVAGYTGGNAGGQGVGAKNVWYTGLSTPQYALAPNYTGYNSKKGFCKIYRGNTNIAS